MVGKKPVVARAAGWSCDLGGQPGFEFSRVIDRSRDTLGRPSVSNFKTLSPGERRIDFAGHLARGLVDEIKNRVAWPVPEAVVG
jgi:hypothetical protein